MKTFPKLLKHYVYALVNPENEEIFYVGRGQNDRGLQHLKLKTDENNSKKQTEIEAIRSKGLEPRLEILRYGLEKETAIEVEAAIIDTIGIAKLTNQYRGDDTSRGRGLWDDLNIRLGGKPLDIESIKNGVILFFCHKAFPYYNIYDSTRQFWKVSEKRIKRKAENEDLHYKYAFGMKENTVLEVFEIIDWFPAGTTVSTRPFNSDGKNEWEFVGSYAKTPLSKYKNRILHEDSIPLKASQIGFRYIN